MSSREEELNFRVTADTKQAATNVGDLKADVSDLEDKPHEVEVVADTVKAEAAAKQLDKRLEGLTDDQKRVVLELAAKDAQRDLDRINRDLAQAHKFGDDEIALRVSARGDAEAKLQAIRAEARELDSVDPTVDVQVKGGDELRKLIDGLDERTGGLGSRLAGLGVGSPAIAGIAALVGGLGLAVDKASELSLEADETANLTGDSVENMSRLLAVMRGSGIEAKDVQDVLLQMAGVLTSNKDLTAQLGINLNDGKTIGERFIQVVDLLARRFDNVGERSVIASQLFGEEGVRQVNAVIARVGDLQTAIDQVPSGLVFDDADVKRGRELQAASKDLGNEFAALGAKVGTVVLPAASTVAKGLNGIIDGAQNWGEQTRAIFTGLADGQLRIESAAQKNVESFEKGREAAANFDRSLLDGLTTWDQVHAKVLEVTGSYDAANVVALEWNSTTKAAIDAQKEHIAQLQETRSQTDGLRAVSAEYTRQVEAQNEATAETVERIQDVRSQTDGLATDLDEAALSAAGLAGNMRLVTDAVAGERQKLSDQSFLLDLQDQLVRVGQAEADVREASKKGADEEAAAKRNQQREVIRLKGMVLDLIDRYDDIPAEKVTRILAAIDSNDLDKIDAAIAELEAGIKVPVEFVMPQTKAAFTSAQIALGQGSVPQLTFAPAPVYNDNRQTTIIPPSTTSPETQATNQRIFLRRGGVQ